MITKVDERLRREADLYAFRFGCECCAAFDVDHGTCVHGYPNDQHARVQLTEVETVVFCKEFDLA